MKPEEIQAALVDGRIDAHAARELPFLFQHDAPAVRHIRESVNLTRDAMEASVTNTDVLRAFRQYPGAADRPGIVQLFETTLLTSVESVDQLSIENADPFHQINAIAREALQPVMRSSINEVWKYMGPELAQDRCTYNPHSSLLVASSFAPHTQDSTFGTLKVVDFSRLADVFGCYEADDALLFLRNLVNAMGQTYTDRIVQADTSDRMREAQAFASIRGKGIAGSIINGFTSGAMDTVNPLDVLVRDVLSTHGPEFFTPEMQQAMSEEHLHFATLLAKFNLLSLARLEDILRIPEDRFVKLRMNMWLQARRDVGGKGYPPNCNYDARYFTTRMTKKNGLDVPVVDFNMEAFTSEELNALQTPTVRFTCPSLGKPHAEFVQAMCRAYWKGVFPILQKDHE